MLHVHYITWHFPSSKANSALLVRVYKRRCCVWKLVCAPALTRAHKQHYPLRHPPRRSCKTGNIWMKEFQHTVILLAIGSWNVAGLCLGIGSRCARELPKSLRRGVVDSVRGMRLSNCPQNLCSFSTTIIGPPSLFSISFASV